jgi:phosphate transport system protein
LETRHQFREDLKGLELQALGGLDMVIQALDRVLESVSRQDVELAAMVVANDDGIDGCYLDVHHRVLALLALEAPVATDLRIVAALLQSMRCVERMGDQCVNIAKLVMLSGPEPPKDKDLVGSIEHMGQVTRSQASRARDLFASRDIVLADALLDDEPTVFRLNRQVFKRAVEIGDDLEVRAWAMLMVLVARALERIAENTIEIAEQAVFIVTGSFREVAGRATRPA